MPDIKNFLVTIWLNGANSGVIRTDLLFSRHVVSVDVSVPVGIVVGLETIECLPKSPEKLCSTARSVFIVPIAR